MPINFDIASSSRQTISLPNEPESLLIPVACVAIAAAGLFTTIKWCFGKREWTKAETSESKNETTIEPVRNEDTPSSSKERRRERQTERNRLRQQKKRQKAHVSTDSESSSTLAVSSSEQSSSSDGSSSSSTPAPRREKRPVSSDEFIHTSYSESFSSEAPAPREPEPLYITDSYIAMNIPRDQYEAFHREAMEILRGQKPFQRSDNPHITIADGQDTVNLTPKQRKGIRDSFDRLIQDRRLVPVRLNIVLHQAGPNAPFEELLILDVEVSQQFKNLRMSLLIDGYIRPNASMHHQGRDFHITLGRRYADPSQSQEKLRARFAENPVLSTVNWRNARL